MLVNGVVVLRLREPAAGLSPLRRAEIVAARHARLNRSTPAGLARLWRDRLVRALTS